MIFARIVYALNWMNIGAIFVLMAPDLGVGVGGLGTLTSAFYLGIGLMQVPGGVMAAKWGPKRLVVVGVFLSSLATLGVSASSSVALIAAFRFLVGTGMAFVFAPGIVIMARLFRGERAGVGVGLFNSAFNLGGGLAIFGWIVVATAIGWRPSLQASGVLGLLTGALVQLFVPGDKGTEGFVLNPKSLLLIIRDRQLILLGFTTLGFGVANLIIASFMVEYLVNALGVGKVTAGLVSSLIVVVPIFTSVWGGALYDRASKTRLLMSVALLGSAGALAIGAFPSVYAAAACAALGGIVSGIGFTFAFAGARDLNAAEKDYDALAIAWVNGISLTGSFVPPLIYTALVENAGYPYAWLGCAVLTLASLVPLALMVSRFRR
jgi:MFS family permease